MNERRISPGRWRTWIVPSALAIAWHGLWWAVLAPAPARARGWLPRAPKVVFAPGEAHEDPEGDPRAVWSPILFSLPTPVGFSRPIMTGAGSVRPPLTAPHNPAVYLERSATVPDAAPALRRERLEDQVGRVLDEVRFDLLDAPPFRLRGAHGAAGPNVEFIDGLSAADFERADLPAGELQSTAAWEALAYLEVDAQGRLVQVLIERPTDSTARNEALARALRRWTPAAGRGARSGKVIIRNAGSPAEAAP
ncbi:MAG: hypothetical protein JXB04_00180 [Kiritimatiellae bacterium]|nr:hypothetical protein [Kiritimatiellia bacterium]